MLGGNRRGRIYGRLDCPAALRALARGGYLANRVFFLDEATAIAAGYRPCKVCLLRWRKRSAARHSVTAAGLGLRMPLLGRSRIGLFLIRP